MSAKTKMSSFDDESHTIKKRIRHNISWLTFVLNKFQEEPTTDRLKRNNVSETLKVIMYNELRLLLNEFRPYLELPPDGPEP